MLTLPSLPDMQPAQSQRGRKRKGMHPRNKYADHPPDFLRLASIYPSFRQYVCCGPNKRARINWTDFNATRELTRSLLHHDYGLTWWIPDGQLCPTVTSRANYIHWIKDLLVSSPAAWHHPATQEQQQVVGIDIGTGANCIYPLLGTTLHGWRFVATGLHLNHAVICGGACRSKFDITPVALKWARQNVESNPHVAELIEVRGAVWSMNSSPNSANADEAGPSHIGPAPLSEAKNLTDIAQTDENADEVAPYIGPALPFLVRNPTDTVNMGEKQQKSSHEKPQSPPFTLKNTVTDYVDISPQGHPELEDSELDRCSVCAHPYQIPFGMGIFSKMEEELGPTLPSNGDKSGSLQNLEVCAERRSHVLVGVVKEEEMFDFCMCNPPFFASMEEASSNPRTACGGTEAEMVCLGGEEAFVARIIDDSAKLKHAIHWYTTMVGRKVSLKGLTAKLWSLGVATVRTTEFVQGRTSRWGLAWSFTRPQTPVPLKTPSTRKTKISFMLEGLGRGCSAVEVLEVLVLQLQLFGALCTLSVPTFSISGFLPEKLTRFKVLDISLNRTKLDSTEAKRGMTSYPLSMDANVTRNSGSTPAFRASVFQQAPGSLLIEASLSEAGDRGVVFAELFELVEQGLKERFTPRSQR